MSWLRTFIPILTPPRLGSSWTCAGFVPSLAYHPEGLSEHIYQHMERTLAVLPFTKRQKNTKQAEV